VTSSGFNRPGRGYSCAVPGAENHMTTTSHALGRDPLPIRGIVVAVPARDEQATVKRCLQAISRAADRVPDHVRVFVVLACDSCHDRTAEIASNLVTRDRRIEVLSGWWASAGEARASAVRLGMRRALERGVTFRELWIATTDADTIVPADWLTRQLAYASDGADAVAGLVDLLHDDDETEAVRLVFDAGYVRADGHAHVHGANLGARADAYDAVGGFPPVRLAEDHALWNALRRAGFNCVSSGALVVATSARLRGRAHGGFADLLRDRLHLPPRNPLAIGFF